MTFKSVGELDYVSPNIRDTEGQVQKKGNNVWDPFGDCVWLCLCASQGWGVRIGVSFLDERCTKFTIFYVFLFNQMRKVWCYGLQFCCLHSTFYNLLCIYKLWYTRDSCTTCILSILEFHMFYFILHIKSNSPLWYKLFLFWYQASLPGRGEGLK